MMRGHTIAKLVFKCLTKVITLSSTGSGPGKGHKIYDMQLELFKSNIQSIFLQNSVTYSNMMIMMVVIYVYMQQLLICL